jgi:hypothetical protein
MAKAERVFGSEGKVLSFPLSGAAFSEQQLNFVPSSPDAEALRKAKRALYDFSAFTNAIPTGQVWQSAGDGSSLPQVYRRILALGKVADLSENPADLARLQAARDVLTRRVNGAEVDTDHFAAYKRCRDAYLLASQQYNAARTSGELGATPESAAEWAEVEPVLRAARDNAGATWKAVGYQAEIDEATATIASLSKKAPVTTWEDWELRSREGIGTETDLTNAPFWPTYITPANAATEGWQGMILNSGEVEQLQKSAPVELRNRLGVGTSPLNVQTLEFEYSSAKLMRPWFDSEIFRARFWKPVNGQSLTISGGGLPPRGECPLYASGVIFFRRIRATVQGNPSSVAAKLDGMGDRPLDGGLFKIQRQHLRTMPATFAPAVRVNPALRAVRPSVIGNARGVAPPVTRSPASSFAVNEATRRRAFLRDVVVMNVHASVAAPATPTPNTTTVIETDSDDIFILALVCTVVPTSPDPDPTLVWT